MSYASDVERERYYIAETAASIADRIVRDLDSGYSVQTRQLAEDVAWIARNLARLARAKRADL